ncbi:DASS family divalent anion:Na+ symporter [Raoultella sp. BIGb0138]|uniref:DASS family sodium-coupled anion symporter n=1 Tax=Raoultella sp. BIGb0138 TaxID=2485115 RepID=UPI001045665D|nr:DASS family sodium-coupled anion symporter [Raoultella sp. BIGb0138]TCW16334.1 DASS family divalent anion:Na+ symporter [Raoultella sp. BIGb0138]
MTEPNKPLEVKLAFPLWKAALTILFGAIIWFTPPPDGLSLHAWQMFAIFAATIFAIILKVLPMGAVTMIALIVSAFLGVTPLSPGKSDKVAALSGFANATIWLIGIAMFISRAVIKTGLGKRVALWFIAKCGSSMLGVAYGLALSDVVLGPGIPSASARGGGIMYPITQSIATAYQSEPGATARKAGAFLMICVSQIDAIVCTMFLTAMAGNPLVAELARSQGIEITWTTWFIGAIVPGIASLILLPLVIYAIYPPQLKKTPEIPAIAREELRKMGPMSLAEKILALDFILLIVLWTVGDIFFAIPATLSAFIGLMVLLVSNIMSWKNIIEEKTAWDTMFWFAVLVMMANALNKYGMISWISARIVDYVGHFEWITVFLLLVVVYFYTRYFFASAMAHISAMYLAFLAVAVSVGVPPLFAALVLGYTSNLSMGLTQYSGGPGPALFGSGYNTTGQWWGVSFVVSIASIFIWLALGGAWMKLVGFW